LIYNIQKSASAARPGAARGMQGHRVCTDGDSDLACHGHVTVARHFQSPAGRLRDPRPTRPSRKFKLKFKFSDVTSDEMSKYTAWQSRFPQATRNRGRCDSEAGPVSSPSMCGQKAARPNQPQLALLRRRIGSLRVGPRACPARTAAGAGTGGELGRQARPARNFGALAALSLPDCQWPAAKARVRNGGRGGDGAEGPAGPARSARPGLSAGGSPRPGPLQAQEARAGVARRVADVTATGGRAGIPAARARADALRGTGPHARASGGCARSARAARKRHGSARSGRCASGRARAAPGGPPGAAPLGAAGRR
jgi:hypothetical protein